MLAPLVAITQTAPPAQPFQRLDGCVYKSQRWNDGDSFHVLLRDQKEVIFRLYFVDTPEEERVYGGRFAEQAAYFGISADAALEVGHEASGSLCTRMKSRRRLPNLNQRSALPANWFDKQA
jgi:hypothetical protein